jgi:hypothetical protein
MREKNMSSFFEEYRNLLKPNQAPNPDDDFYGSPLKAFGEEKAYQVDPNWMFYQGNAITLGNVALRLLPGNPIPPDVSILLEKMATIFFHEALLRIYEPIQPLRCDFFGGVNTFFAYWGDDVNQTMFKSYKLFLKSSLAIIWLEFKKRGWVFPIYDHNLNLEKYFYAIDDDDNDVTLDFLKSYELRRNYSSVLFDLEENLEWYLENQTNIPRNILKKKGNKPDQSNTSLRIKKQRQCRVTYTTLPFCKLFNKIHHAQNGGNLDFFLEENNAIPMYEKAGRNLVWATFHLLELNELLTAYCNSTSETCIAPVSKPSNMNNQISDGTESIPIPTTVQKIVNSCYPTSSRLFNSNLKPSDNTAVLNTDENTIFYMFKKPSKRRNTTVEELKILDNDDVKLTIPEKVLKIVKDEHGDFLCFDLYVYFIQNLNEEPIYVPSEIIDEDFFPSENQDENQVVVTINLDANSDGSVELENGIRFSPKSTKVGAAFDRSDEHDGYVVVICFFGE